MDYTVCALRPTDAPAFRELRLEALQAHPEAFGSDYESESKRTPAKWETLLKDRTFFGAWRENKLVGMIGFMRHTGAKQDHTGKFISMYVQPDMRGKGVGKALAAEALLLAQKQVEQVMVDISTTNTPAYQFYQGQGFTPFGTTPRAVKIGDTYYDEHLMVKDLRS